MNNLFIYLKLFLFILVGSCLFNFQCLQAQSQANEFTLPLSYVREDFNQNKVVQASGFFYLDRKTQNELLWKDYIKKKRWKYIWQALYLSSPGLALVSGSFFMDYRMHLSNIAKQKIAVENDSTLNENEKTSRLKNISKQSSIRHVQPMMSFLLGPITAPLLLTAIYPLQKAIWLNLKEPLNNLEKKYIHQKRFMASDIQERVESNLIFAHAHPLRNIHQQRIISHCLELPFETMPITLETDSFFKVFSGFSANKVSPIFAHFFTIFNTQSSIPISAADSSKGHKKRHQGIYFHGAPGTGKTYLAQKIAKVLNLPSAVLAFGSATLKDITGTETDPGLLLQALKGNSEIGEKTALNKVLILDEVDRPLQSQHSNEYNKDLLDFLLKLTDPTGHTFYSPFLNANIDTSELIIIMLGNYDLQDSALSSRLVRVKFDGFDPAHKRKIIWEEIIPGILANINHYSTNAKLTLEDLTPEQLDLINRAIAEDLDPGFRSIQTVLNLYFNNLMALRSVKNTDQYLIEFDILGYLKTLNNKCSEWINRSLTDKPAPAA